MVVAIKSLEILKTLLSRPRPLFFFVFGVPRDQDVGLDDYYTASRWLQGQMCYLKVTVIQQVTYIGYRSQRSAFQSVDTGGSCLSGDFRACRTLTVIAYFWMIVFQRRVAFDKSLCFQLCLYFSTV